MWEKKFYAFPIPLGGESGKLAAPAPQTWSKVLAQFGLTVALGTLAVTLQHCPPVFPCMSPAVTSTSTLSATEAFNAALTSVWGTSIAGVQTAQAVFTPTPMPTATATPVPSPYFYTVRSSDSGLLAIAIKFGISVEELKAANGSSDIIWVGKQLVIPVNIPSTLSPVLADMMRNERPTDTPSQEAWGALNIFGDLNSTLYPNNWWLADGSLSLSDALSITMQGEAASNLYGQQAIAGRYIYYCGTTPNCNGDTSKLLEFFSYYHAWRESGYQAENIRKLPSQNITDITAALTTGNTAYLQQIGVSGAVEDMPFHFANVSSKWEKLLIAKLGRGPNQVIPGGNNFWVLSINELQRVCPSWGVASPDMTRDETLNECH